VDAVIDALLEIFAWAGLGLGALAAGFALMLFLLDGTWLPVRAVVEELEGSDGASPRYVVRWFDEGGGVNEAPLSGADHHRLGAKDMADIYYRRGWTNRMRLTPGSPAARAAALLAAVFAGVGVVALVLSWIVLFARG
jgi:hypothetical protein